MLPIIERPKSATFLVKYGCNLNCSFCLNEWRGKAQPKDELLFEQQIQIIHKLHASGIKHVTFTGGEPTLHPRIADLVKEAKTLGMSTLLQTNGTRLSEKLLTDLKPFVDGIQVSLEGLKEEQRIISKVDCFDKIIEGMQRVKKHNIRLFTNFTITKQNHHCLDDYLKLVNSLGVEVASFTRLYPAGRAIDNEKELTITPTEYAAFLKKLKTLEPTSKTKIYLAGPTDAGFLDANNLHFEQKAICTAGKTEFAINPNGEVLPCPSWNQPIGNLAKQTVNEVWNAPVLRAIGNHDGQSGCMLARARKMGLEAERLKTPQTLSNQKRNASDGTLDRRALDEEVRHVRRPLEEA